MDTDMHQPKTPSRLPRAALALALALCGLGGCATSRAAKAPDLVWPFPPEKPRIKFVRAFQSESDLAAGGLTQALRILVPPSPDAVVAQPTGLAVTPDGRLLYVACSNVSRILRVDLKAGKMSLFADDEGKKARLPFALALDAQENVYTTDMANKAVMVYAPDGKFLRRIAVGDKPTGMAVDPRRQLLYVVVGANQHSDHRIEVYTLAGEKVRTMGTRGADPGQFNFPTNLGVGPDGNLYVVDMLNFRIQVFDADGQVVTMFGQPGAGEPGTFDKAKGIGFDAFGNIYVSDSQQGTVQIFNAKFQVLMAFAGRVVAPGYLLSPTAVTVDGHNHIFVADYATGVVNEYELIGTTAADSFGPGAESGPQRPGSPSPASSK